VNGADYRFDNACRYYDAGQIPAAIDTLTELLSEQPNEALYHGLLASCLLQQQRVVAAEFEIGIALGLDPDLPFLHQVLARVLILNRKLDDALDACNAALLLDPESAGSHLLKVEILTLQERHDDARIELDRAAGLDADNMAVAIAYGDYHNNLGEHEAALGHAANALHRNPASGAANVLMGETQLALGHTDDADYHAKFAIVQDPGSVAALRLFANIRMRNNRFVGIWWRFNSWLATLGNMKSALVLIGGFLAFNLLSEITADLGYATTSSVLTYAWLIIVLYSWIGLPMYHKAMARELSSFSFNRKF
jgi:tetratricopeptide (TPR) repeat protein